MEGLNNWQETRMGQQNHPLFQISEQLYVSSESESGEAPLFLRAALNQKLIVSPN